MLVSLSVKFGCYRIYRSGYKDKHPGHMTVWWCHIMLFDDTSFLQGKHKLYCSTILPILVVTGFIEVEIKTKMLITW